MGGSLLVARKIIDLSSHRGTCLWSIPTLDFHSQNLLVDEGYNITGILWSRAQSVPNAY